jgi:MOSC domain-containing protein YiiM
MSETQVTGLFFGGVETFIAADGRPMTSGIRKRPSMSVDVGPAGIPGDASTEVDHHTRDKAVHIFSEEHYAAIAARLGMELPRPTFGENIAMTGVTEGDVCVGDVIRIGSTLLRVTQPTERCKAIGRNLGAPKILKVLHEMELCGFYCNVAMVGRIAVGDRAFTIDRPQPEWTVKRLHRVMFRSLSDEALLAEVLALPDLSEEWKRRARLMRERQSRGEPLSSNLVDL